MNKQELIGTVSAATSMSKTDVAKIVDAIFDTITESLKRGDEVRLVGFGTFSVTARKPTLGRNPRTGEPMPIDTTNTPKFRAGKVLKDAVN
jgi:DNA-binding protein HU-beta